MKVVRGKGVDVEVGNRQLEEVIREKEEIEGKIRQMREEKIVGERGKGSGVSVRKVGSKEGGGKREKQRGGGGVRTGFRIRLLNVQGLTEVKYMELKRISWWMIGYIVYYF